MVNLGLDGSELAFDGDRRGDDNRRHGYSNDPVPPPFKKYLTVQNMLQVVIILFLAGTFWERNQNTTAQFDRRLEAIEANILAAAERQDTTFVRRDVIEERLRAITDQLVDIREAVKRSGR